MNSKIIKFGAGPNGEDIEKLVKNLGWLLRNWKEINYLFIHKNNNLLPQPECKLMASVKGKNLLYYTDYASYQVCLNFLNRSIFQGLRVIIKEANGAESPYIVGSEEYKSLIK